MKICYLTWGETPRSYGVFGSQVLGQFIETKKIMQNDAFYFIAAVPLIHSGLLREKFNYKNEIKKVIKRLRGINFIKIPIFSSQNFVLSSKLTFPFMHLLSHIVLHKKLKTIQPDVLHCRSYHAAWAALKVRERFGHNFKIIFDGRGLYPEEIALKLKFKKHSINFKFLKKIEKELLEKCDKIIAVSDTMKAHYKKINSRKINLIYLSASEEKLKPLLSSSVLLKEKKITFCYVGALSNETWHRIDELLELFKHLKRELNNIKFVIITTSNHQYIKKKFKNLSDDELLITSTKTVEDLNCLLKGVDYGVLQYRKEVKNFEIAIGETMLGTKTVEYLLAGLPVIVNKFCGGASYIINKNNLGISYDPNTFEELNKENLIETLSAKKSNEISALAKEMFDYKNNAIKYNKLYKSLI